MPVLPEVMIIKDFFLPVVFDRYHREPIPFLDLFAKLVGIIGLVPENDGIGNVSEAFTGRCHLVTIAGHEEDSHGLAEFVDDTVNLGVPPALGLSKRLIGRVSRMTTRILVSLDVTAVDDFETDGLSFAGGDDFQHPGPDSPVAPSVEVAVDAVPIPISRRQIVPLASRHQNIPNPIQIFSKIEAFAPSF